MKGTIYSRRSSNGPGFYSQMINFNEPFSA